MRKYAFRIGIVAAVLIIGIYYLLPTWRDYQLTQELRSLKGLDSTKFADENEKDIRENRARRIKLGLDLQGGMRVVLEVNTLKLIEDIAKNKDDQFSQIVKEVAVEAGTSDESPVALLRKNFEAKGIRMSKHFMSLRNTNDEIAAFLEDESKKAIDRAIEIVRNRVDQYGVSEPSIAKLGGSRIIVELPGVSNEREVRDLIGKTARLEFKLLKEPDQAMRVVQEIDKLLAGKDTVRDTTSLLTKEDTLKAHQFTALIGQFQEGDLFALEENKDKVRRILDRDDVKRILPPDFEFLWSAKGENIRDASGKNFYFLYPVKKQAELEGGVVTNAKATIDQGTAGHVVDMEMNSEGAKEWARITGANIKKRVAIVMDNGVFSAPVVQQKIIGGRSQISGMSNLEEARLIEIVLKAGALPAPVEIVEQRSVGPSLGEDSIRYGVSALLIATLLTLAFMILYYRTSGLIANVALIMCLLLLLGVLAAFQGTLTLPGIAGIILTLAVAVDANVLIYERIREEQATGKTLRAAIEAGYEKAWTAILDSNLTTMITALIMYEFGTGPVKGFALTLIIGIGASMFTAIFVTRIIFNVLTEKRTAVSLG